MISSGAVVYWLSMRTHNAGVVGSSLPYITIKTPLARNAMGRAPHQVYIPRKTQRPVSGFCYARNQVCGAVSFLGDFVIALVFLYWSHCTLVCMLVSFQRFLMVSLDELFNMLPLEDRS